MIDQKIDNIRQLASRNGLVIRGGFLLVADDEVGEIEAGISAKSMLLFGNAGSSLWEVFSNSGEYQDSKQDPLDRWSERVGNSMAKELGGKAFFPFGDPPYQPFISWAKRSEGLESSRLGMLIHGQYGLWHAYRFGIAFSEDMQRFLEEKDDSSDICAACVEQPCLSRCPVTAFGEGEYDVEACYRYIKEAADNSCMDQGCAARRACPEGSDFLYRKVHAQFHMSQFLSSMKVRFDD